MTSRVVLTRQTIRAAMQSPPVREAIEARARSIAGRADGLAASEGVEVDARVRSGTRPKGRPFSQVESSNAAQEWGDERTARRRILGRAAGLG